MAERVVDVFDENGACIVTYTVRITAFNRTLCPEDFEREALWMAATDKVVPSSREASLTAKARPGHGPGPRAVC
ncbi:hypothetical protein KXS07_21525 [Inquilinus limosus]|uniref:hypothetical protein n=1 Tax=Inquilinus limosus TaxID=171674 RepID=UPI00047DDADD|nr:hypothetical protein [Inquilinus limosus]